MKKIICSRYTHSGTQLYFAQRLTEVITFVFNVGLSEFTLLVLIKCSFLDKS